MVDIFTNKMSHSYDKKKHHLKYQFPYPEKPEMPNPGRLMEYLNTRRLAYGHECFHRYDDGDRRVIRLSDPVDVHLNFLIESRVYNGGILSQTIARCNPGSLQTFLMHLQKMYDLFDEEVEFKYEKLTLQDLVVSFPTKVVQLYHDAHLNIQNSVIGLGSVLSSAVMCPFFSACIPSIYMGGRTNLFPFNVLAILILEKYMGRCSSIKRIFQFCYTMYKNEMTPNTVRMKMFKDWGLLDFTGLLRREFIDSRVAVCCQIRELRWSDPDIEEVMITMDYDYSNVLPSWLTSLR